MGHIRRFKMSSNLTRVLLVTDHVEPTPAVRDALCARTACGPVGLRVIVPNPAAAEWHPLHPERHVKAAEARDALARTLPIVEASCGVTAEGCVAVAHDPMDAIEQSLARTASTRSWWRWPSTAGSRAGCTSICRTGSRTCTSR